jgi:hypothetical protein
MGARGVHREADFIALATPKTAEKTKEKLLRMQLAMSRFPKPRRV